MGGGRDEIARAKILSMLTQTLKLEGEVDLFKIARSTSGFGCADLEVLLNEAGTLAMKRLIRGRVPRWNLEDCKRRPFDESELQKFSITMADFENAAKILQLEKTQREGFSPIPDITWDDVGGLSLVRKVFEKYVIRPIKHPEFYEELGTDLEEGFLLFGPPGCGKTLVAKAVANEAGANFIHIKGTELLNKCIGESELDIRKLFARARTNSPCILFFDEVDALTRRRDTDKGCVVERLMNQFLIELDEADNREDVYIIGATNRMEAMDPAVLRPGRFGKILYLPVPGADERVAIMKALARKKLFDADVDFDSLLHAEQCNNLTGADLASVMHEASLCALDEMLDSATNTTNGYKCRIKQSHLEHALSKKTPSVSEKQRKYY